MPRGRPKGKKNITILKSEMSIKDTSVEPIVKKGEVKRDPLTEEQYYAVKRAYSILEGHIKDDFKEPLFCQAIFEGSEFLKKFIDKYERRK